MKLALNQVKEIVFTAENSSQQDYKNIKAMFTCGETTLNIPAYFKGNNTWAVHFSPPSFGEWNYVAYNFETSEQLDSGKIVCTQNTDIISPLYVGKSNDIPMFFAEDKPYLVNAYECDWLFSLWMQDKESAKRLIENITKHKFNSVVMNIYAHKCVWTNPDTEGTVSPPPIFCWGGTNEEPDFSVINEDFYSKFDELMDYLAEKKVYVFLYYFVFNKFVSYPERDSEEEQMYIKQICARYQAYPNIVWVYSKEAYRHEDANQILRSLKIMRHTDAYKRLLSVQDHKATMFDEEMLKYMNFFMLQKHSDFYEYTKNLVEKKLRPVFFSEFGYEAGKTVKDKTYNDAQEIKTFVLRALDIILAGGSTCYYYTFTGWDVIRPDDVPPGYEIFKTIHEFFTSLDWWNYLPEPNFHLWSSTRTSKHIETGEYITVTNGIGQILINYDSERVKFAGSWLNPFTGEKKELTEGDIKKSVDNPRQTVLVSPFEEKTFTILKLSIN